MGIIILVAAFFYWKELLIDIENNISKNVINITRAISIALLAASLLFALAGKGLGRVDVLDYVNVFTLFSLLSICIATISVWFAIVLARCFHALKNGQAPGVKDRGLAFIKIFSVIAFGSFVLPASIGLVVISFIIFLVLKKLKILWNTGKENAL